MVSLLLFFLMRINETGVDACQSYNNNFFIKMCPTEKSRVEKQDVFRN